MFGRHQYLGKRYSMQDGDDPWHRNRRVGRTPVGALPQSNDRPTYPATTPRPGAQSRHAPCNEFARPKHPLPMVCGGLSPAHRPAHGFRHVPPRALRPKFWSKHRRSARSGGVISSPRSLDRANTNWFRHSSICPCLPWFDKRSSLQLG